MLTILWRKPDGAERLFTADSIERTNPEGEQCVPAFGKFRAFGASFDGLPGKQIEFEIEKPFGAVFVMNEAGRTMARYLAE